MNKLVVVLALLAACGETKSDPPPAPTRSDVCANALSSFDRLIDVGDPDKAEERRAKFKAFAIERCTQDNWSDASITCMRYAKTSHDLFKCWNDQLTKEQRDAVKNGLGLDLK